MTKSELMKKAHQMTREIKAEFPNVDYKFQLGLCIAYLQEEGENEMEVKKENKELTRLELWEKFGANTKATNTFMNLYQRWQSEKEYEDINDYLEVIKKYLPEAFKISKKPFGVTCKCADGNIKIFCKIKGNYITVNASLE